MLEGGYQHRLECHVLNLNASRRLGGHKRGREVGSPGLGLCDTVMFKSTP